MDNTLKYMNFSIELANKGLENQLKTGAVLVINSYQVFSAYNGEIEGLLWSDCLLKKISDLNITEAEELYLTINNINNGNFILNNIINKIKIKRIYFGLPDPKLNKYLDDDPVLKLNNIYRYPDTLQQKILNQNKKYYENCSQSIKQNQYYSSIRISKLVIEKLKKYGLEISSEELKLVKNTNSLAQYLDSKYKKGLDNVKNVIQIVLSESFNEKYSSYNYSNDARSIDIDWWKNFKYVYDRNTKTEIEELNIINVGVGSGNEAIKLFSNCKRITFVDIARNGLENIKMKIPQSKFYISPAEKITAINNNEFDLYISLRTYNSSFFNVNEALNEAYRVIKNNGLIIISLANGFLCSEEQRILPGLIIPGTELVDLYRGFSMVKELVADFKKIGFKDTKIYSSNSELYLSARVCKQE